jgi:hypothetical protein
MVLTLEYGYGRTYLPTQRTRRKGRKKKKKNPCINPGHHPEKWPEIKKKKKKNPDPDLGFRTSTFKTWTDGKKIKLNKIKKKFKKILVLTLGSPPEKGGKKKPWSRSRFQDLDFQDLKPIIETSTDRRTDAQTTQLI